MDFNPYSFCAIVLLWLPWSEAGCKEDLPTDSKYIDCTAGIFGYMMSVDQLSMPDSLTDAANLICSPEGKKAFGCIISYIDKCPALIEITTISSLMSSIEQIPTFDLLLLKGGIEDICAVLVGPCSKVNDCITKVNEYKGTARSGTNYYQMFAAKAIQMCGKLKTPMDCMLQALDRCTPSVMGIAENKFEEALKVATRDEFGNFSFQDVKNFILNVCPNMPKDFVPSMCLNVPSSPNFTECNINATIMIYQEKTCT